MFQTLSEAVNNLSSTKNGFHFTNTVEDDQFVSFYNLRKRVQSLALKYKNVGLQPKDTVVLLFTSQSEFIQGFLSAICAGLVVAPLAPPNITENLEDYTHRVDRILNITKATTILTSESIANKFQAFLPNIKLLSLNELESFEEQGELPKISSADLALLQFTSGSTSAPKGVAITHANLVANANAIQHALQADPQKDRGVSWLPLHHDMGLIGFLVTPIFTQVSIWYLPPIEFARRPHRWLELMHQTRATISFAPNFGYDLVSRRLKESDVQSLDLSHWRVAGCGGEPVIPKVLETFYTLLQPAHFKRTAFLPSYGLAEATLAVSMSPLDLGTSTNHYKNSADQETMIVSSGKAVNCAEIRIVSNDGVVLPDGCEGEIQVRGAAVARMVWSDNGFEPACDQEGWLSTGDLGVMFNGNLHVSGRLKEVVALNGCKYHPHDIEECVMNIEGIKRGNVVAFGRPSASSEQLVLMIETNTTGSKDELKKKLRARVREELGLSIADVVTVGRGTISRTTSGKIQRRKMRSLYLSNALTA